MKSPLFCSALTALALLACSAAIATPCKVGVITDLSGQMSSWGRQTQIGAKMALDEINGQNGDLTLVFADHQLQAKNAVREIKKLIEVDRVDALFVDFSGPAVAAAPIAREAGVLYVYSGGATSALSVNPLAFKSFIDFKNGCRRVTEKWKEQGVKRIAILKPSTEFGELCLQGAKEAHPEIAAREFNPGDEVATQVAALKTLDIQAILNPAHVPDYIRMLKALQIYKYTPLLARQEDDISQTTRMEFPDLMRLTTFFGLKEPSPEFLEKLKQQQGKDDGGSPVTSALSYLHIRQIHAAVSRCPSRDLNCQSTALAASPADETLRFLGWKDRVAAFEIALK